MKKQQKCIWWAGLLVLVFAWNGIGMTHGQNLPFSATGRPIDLSLRMEVARAIDRGNQWLMKHQNEAGHWSDADHPALTSLALVALQRDPVEHHAEQKEPVLVKGYDYLRSSAQSDGGIYRIEMLQNYNTSVSVMALLMRQHPDHEDLMRRARQFVIRGQQDLGSKVVLMCLWMVGLVMGLLTSIPTFPTPCMHWSHSTSRGT